ncbi:hypothetical protein FRC12_011676, partial [Ceratobasidium sp. 428]
MADHQKYSIRHARLLERTKAAKRSKVECSRLVLYYPSSSPEEPIEDATPLFYDEPAELKPFLDNSSHLDSSSKILPRKGLLEPLEQRGEI